MRKTNYPIKINKNQLKKFIAREDVSLRIFERRDSASVGVEFTDRKGDTWVYGKEGD